MAFNRKFQDGQTVILTNPRAERKRYANQEFKVEWYHSGSYAPYRIRSVNSSYPLYVNPNEITLLDESVPRRALVVPMDYNQLAFSHMNLKKWDKVRVNFIPTVAQAKQLGLSAYAIQYIENSKTSNDRYVGKEGRVLYPAGNGADYCRIIFDDGSQRYFLAVGLELLQRSVEVESFKASTDYNATVFDFGVQIYGTDILTFEMFESLWKEIQEHIAKPKRGEARRVKLQGSWDSGILHRTYIEVGCQRFSYKNVEKLMETIAQAKKVV